MVTKRTSSFKRRVQNSPAKHQRHVKTRLRTKAVNTRHLIMFVQSHYTNAELLRATELPNQGKWWFVILKQKGRCIKNLVFHHCKQQQSDPPSTEKQSAEYRTTPIRERNSIGRRSKDCGTHQLRVVRHSEVETGEK